MTSIVGDTVQEAFRKEIAIEQEQLSYFVWKEDYERALSVAEYIASLLARVIDD